ncbi:MAG: DUF45 domain-containing protein [Candidatus Aenigmarchaeota archaeon]|nr:DUF45 domain-containing protein [Candidatus Aenigmarchaeota archaeon]
MQTEEFFIGRNKYILKVLMHRKWSSTASMQNNVVTIRLSSRANKAERQKHLDEFREWAIQRIRKNPERYKPPYTREYRNQDVIDIGGEKFALRIDYTKRKSASGNILGNIIRLNIPEAIPEEDRKKHISSVLAKIVAQRRLPRLQNKINLLNNLFFRKELGDIKFKNMSSRWGSCSRHGNITISSRLLLAPDEILEYVCVHELAHLVHFNHSKKYWELVGKVIPDYKERDKWLSKNGEKCVF